MHGALAYFPNSPLSRFFASCSSFFRCSSAACFAFASASAFFCSAA